MQLGKLDVSQDEQAASNKTGGNGAQEYQRVAAKKQNEFQSLVHSVYDGCKRLGRYELVSVRPSKRYAAYDARNRLLGRFQTRKAAWTAIRRAAKGG